MPFEKRWLLKDRVCYVQFTKSITLEDVATVSKLHNRWVATNHHQGNIHYIVNMMQIVDYPHTIREINAHLDGRMTHTGWLLLITDDFYIKYIGDVFGQLLHFNVKTVHSVVDGYRFLQSMDEVPIPQDWPDNINDTMPLR